MGAADKLSQRIKKQVGKAIGDFSLIEEGDRILVAVSGGKDSYVLLHMLETLRRKAPVSFTLKAVNIDPGFPGYRSDLIADYLASQGLDYHIEVTQNNEIIEENLREGTSYCAFCARMRRGFLYSAAQRLNCNKVALGHHLDDFIETLLLNQFFSGKLAAMSAKMKADNGLHTIIRPLVYVEESDIALLSQELAFPIIDCNCPVVGATDQNRQKMKQLISTLAEDIPAIRSSMLRAIRNVQPRQLLDDRIAEKDSK